MVVVEAIRTPSELPAELYRYDLSAVITHEGKLDNGHYWACVRSGQEWFHLDDDRGELARSELEVYMQVLPGQAYRLLMTYCLLDSKFVQPLQKES